jgi:hypothetical protein
MNPGPAPPGNGEPVGKWRPLQRGMVWLCVTKGGKTKDLPPFHAKEAGICLTAWSGFLAGSTAPAHRRDFKAGPAQQNQLSLVPFSAYGKPYPITRL